MCICVYVHREQVEETETEQVPAKAMWKEREKARLQESTSMTDVWLQGAYGLVTEEADAQD